MNDCGNNGRGCLVIIDDDSKQAHCKEKGCTKLSTFDFLHDISEQYHGCDIVEIRFKNTRKGFYKNVNKLNLEKGDIVAVESSPGHDIGIVSLIGELVRWQMKKQNISLEDTEFKKIYRKAKGVDIDKWQKSLSKEHQTMIRARKMAEDLNLEMKIGDVEYQGDGTKAIFYYIADDRVDFRELIKVMAEEFKIRIEMKQIGARQEAGRIGGIGTCGRELCCATYITNFVSVTTSSARYQEVSLNPQKLAGQCGKLKCCLNYELDAYLDAQEDFPDTNIPLDTDTGLAYHKKTDVFRRLMWYSYDKDETAEIACLPVEKVKEIIEMNKKGQKVKKLESIETSSLVSILEYQNTVDEDVLSSFEDKQPVKQKNKEKRHHNSRHKNHHKRKPFRKR